jgi:hypothetical protein
MSRRMRWAGNVARMRLHTKFWSENLKVRDHSEDIGLDGRIILEWILWKSAWEGVDWIHVAQDRDLWRAVVNTVMNLRVP